MFKFFDRYVLKELSSPFFIGLLIYTFVLLMNHILILSENLITRGVSFSATVKIFVYLIPSILAFTVPMAVLMGVLAGLSRLSTDQEVVAFKTLGISNTRLLVPVLLFGFGGWLLSSFLALYLAPQANYKWVQTIAKSVMDRVQFRIYPLEFNESIPNTMIYTQEIDQENYWNNIFIYLSSNFQEPRAILASKGRLNFYPELKRATLELYSGTVHSYPLNEPERYSITTFERLEEDIDVESFFTTISAEKRVREKDIKELLIERKAIRQELEGLRWEEKELQDASSREAEQQRRNIAIRIQVKSAEHRSYLVEIHKKFALPFACLIFVFLGLPLGITTRKGGRTSGFTISIGIILVYYVLITAGEKLAMDGRMSPFLGMWGANFLFMAAGVYLFVKSSRESPFFSRLTAVLNRLRMLSVSKKSTFSLRLPRFPLNFPNILDRYIIRKYTVIFVLIFLSLLSISVIVTFFERIDNIYEHQKSLAMLFDYIRYKIPEFIYFIFPITVLTATLLTLGILTKFNEITAMKASGISVYRIILPLLFMAVVVSVLSFFLQERILPYSNRKAEETWNRINDFPSRSYSHLDRRWMFSRNKNRVYHYSYFDPVTEGFSQLSIFDLDLTSWSMKKRMYSEKAYLSDGALSLGNCWWRDFVDDRAVNFAQKDAFELPLEEGKSYFLKEWKEPSQMNYTELRRFISEVKDMGFDTVKLGVDLRYKVSFPFVCLIMTLLGIPFAFSMGKRGALVGIGLSIVIAMVYWGTIGIFKGLGYVHFLSAFFASWGPNLIFGLTGIYLLFRLRT